MRTAQAFQTEDFRVSWAMHERAVIRLTWTPLRFLPRSGSPAETGAELEKQLGVSKRLTS
jgi:hypothetical protein